MPSSASRSPSPSLLLPPLLAALASACPHEAPTVSDGATPGAAPDEAVGAPAAPTEQAAPVLPLAEVEPSSLDPDETVVFLPTFAVLQGGMWRVPIDAWVFEPEEDDIGRHATVKTIAEALEAVPGSPESDVIAKNLRPFVVDNERDQMVAVRRGAHAVRVGPTGPDGRARAVVELPEGDPAASGEGTPPWVELEVVLPRGDDRRLVARAQLLPDEGLSLVSDVDDTVKITHVLDKREMLRHTFLLPYQAVPGMPEAYQRYAAQGVAIHYVSASPLPLYGALVRFAQAAGFPSGSLSLRPFRWTDGTAIELLDPSETYKTETIAAIVEAFEQRAFVLVGDTGERDPEIYAAIARRFPDRVRSIWLRDPVAGGTPGLDARLQAAYEGLPRSLWHVIVDGSGLPERL